MDLDAVRRLIKSLAKLLGTDEEAAVRSNNMRKLGVPFFSFGFLAAIYDAPCNNLGKYARLEWIADTFLVTLPSRINEDTISYLLGFKWGYEESRDKSNHEVKILLLEVTNLHNMDRALIIITR